MTASQREDVDDFNELVIIDGTKSGKLLVEIDEKYFRPAEVDFLLGDPSKAKAKLGWEPKIKFKELVKMMVEADLEILKKQPEYKYYNII